MASSPVSFIGRAHEPRYVFVVDKVAKAVENSTDVGLADEDVIVMLEREKLEEVSSFFEHNVDTFKKAQAFIFLQIGQNNISHDADEVLPAPLSATVESYFAVNGPREVPGDDFPLVVSKYEALVKKMLETFPEALVFSTNPAARKSSCGFAVRRAMGVANKIKKQDERHHHFSLIKRFIGRREGKTLGEGGRFPIFEHYFSNGGVELTRAALAGTFVRAYAFVNAVTGVGRFLKEAEKIEGVKMLF